ncbi:MAG: peptide deformylase [Alphaproteobacteria bacterium 33-17]|nr:MAG: peptide deformylase [Alphaproteobacteria bacterium 33-17]
MAVLPIIIGYDQSFRTKCSEVESLDDQTKAFINDMFETMRHNKGCGMAASHVGVHKRIVVVDISDDYSNPQAFINPVIIKKSDEANTYKEGSISFPGEYADVTRPKEITVKYRDLDWQECEITADGLLATCLQHEIDHHDGILFIDQISPMKRRIILERIKKKYKK